MLQLNIQFMVHRSIQFFPQKFSALQRQVAVGAKLSLGRETEPGLR